METSHDARLGRRSLLAGPGLVIATLFIGRTALDMEHNMIYIFFPTFAKEFQVQLWQTGLLVTVYSAVNLASPIFGRISDRIGRKIMMILGLGVFCVAEMLFVLAADWTLILSGRTLVGLSSAIFTPSQSAYLGDQFEYSKRARIMGLVRLAFPISGVLAPVFAGYSIEKLSWRIPFATMDVIALFAIVLLTLKLPEGSTKGAEAYQNQSLPSFKEVVTNPRVTPCLIASFLAIWSIEGFWIFMTPWMKDVFSLGETVIGVIFSLSSVASVMGTLLASWYADRAGKRRSTWTGLIVSAFLMMAVPNLGHQLSLAVLAFILLGVTFDFAMTAWLPLLTELVPEARGTMMALNSAATSLGAASGAFVNGFVWTALGYPSVGFICFIATTISGFIISYKVSERIQL